MQLQLDIAFDQLVKLAKRLPKKEWMKLKQEVDQEHVNGKPISDLESFLLAGPTFTKKQLDEVAKTRKAINQWRTK